MINLVLFGFVTQILILAILGIPCTLDMKCVPRMVKELFCYGKASESYKHNLNVLVKAIQIPKSCFTHFYWFASLQMLAVCIVLLYTLILKNSPPTCLIFYANFFASHHKGRAPTTVAPQISILVAALFLFHVSRRLYETQCISVFSNASMNLFHYFCGLFHYWGCSTILLAYAVDWDGTDYSNPYFSEHSIGLQQFMGVLLFIYASFQQFSIHHQLASYRKKFKRDEEYFLPCNGLFDYVSCPNFFCEILIYLSLYAILGFNHLPWGIVSLWVIENQTLSASMAHKWYRERFQNYPLARKAIIPFIY